MRPQTVGTFVVCGALAIVAVNFAKRPRNLRGSPPPSVPGPAALQLEAQLASYEAKLSSLSADVRATGE
eukprot:1542301-Prymnesium_polylepis.1